MSVDIVILLLQLAALSTPERDPSDVEFKSKTSLFVSPTEIGTKPNPSAGAAPESLLKHFRCVVVVHGFGLRRVPHLAVSPPSPWMTNLCSHLQFSAASDL